MMETLGNLSFLILLIALILIVLGLSRLVPFLISIRPRRPREAGFKYVYVNDNGTVRELDEDEVDYLNTDFEGGDGNRPYIKSNYGSLTPNGKMGGYLWRRHVPKSIRIDPPPSNTHPN